MMAIVQFITDETILKELFSKILDGDLSKIDYECDTDKKYNELMKFASEVVNDFFSLFNKNTKK